VCDRIKSTLSESCLKYVLSVESSHDSGWLPIKELTECVDRFCAAKGDWVKPRAYAIGQTPQKSGQKSHFQFDKSKGQSHTPGPSKGGGEAAQKAPDVMATPRKQIVCYECQKPGHIRSNCPNLNKSTTGSIQKASVKRVQVIENDAAVIDVIKNAVIKAIENDGAIVDTTVADNGPSFMLVLRAVVLRHGLEVGTEAGRPDSSQPVGRLATGRPASCSATRRPALQTT